MKIRTVILYFLLMMSTFPLHAQKPIPCFEVLDCDLLARTQSRMDNNDVPCAIGPHIGIGY